MDQQVQKIRPNYKKIYQDILNDKFPEKKDLLNIVLKKQKFTSLDIIEINQMIFGLQTQEIFTENQKHRSYEKLDILQILDFQKKHHLTNSKVAQHFKVSRNSISKWKKIYLSSSTSSLTQPKSSLT